MGFNPIPVFVISLVFSLSGCLSRTDISSSITFENEINLTIGDIIKSVAKKSEDLDGKCTIKVDRINCRFDKLSNGISIDVNAGVRNSGEMYINVHSVVTSWLPASRKKILTGDILPVTHKNWEIWMKNTYPDGWVKFRDRSYASFDIKQDF